MKMNDQIGLCIAGLRFVLKTPEGAMLGAVERSYLPFLCEAADDGETIDVTIHPEMPPTVDIVEMERVFETGQSWSMFRRRDDFYLALNLRGFKNKPLCVAQFGSAADKVRIYCDTMLVDKRGDTAVIENVFSYPLDRLLTMYILASRDGALFHAAGIDIGGRGYLFPGLSGSGKTTLSRNFVSVRGAASVISDERVAVRKADGVLSIFGTPWPGEAGIAVNRRAPLSGICFIRHGEVNTIRALKPDEALTSLLPLVSIPWYDHSVMTGILRLCEKLVSSVPLYEVGLTPGEEAADFLEDALSSSALST